MRRALALLLKAVLALVALIAVVLVFTVGLLYTDYGRRKLAGVVEDQAASALSGELSIGSIALGLGGSLRASDIVIPEQLSVERVALDCDLGDIVGGFIHCSELRVVGPIIHLIETADRGIELALQLKPGDPSAPAPRVRIDAIVVEDGQVVLHRLDGSTEVASGVGFSGSLSMAPDQMSVVVAQLAAAWREATLTVASARFEDQVAVVADAALRYRESWLLVESGRYAVPTGEASVQASAELEPGDAAQLAPAAEGLEQRVSVGVGARREANGQPVSVELTVGAGEGALRVTGLLEPEAPAAQLAVRLQALRPDALWRGAPEGQVDGALDLAIRGADPATMTARVTGEIAGRLAGAPRTELRIDAQAEAGELSGTIEIGTARGTGAVRATARHTPRGWLIERAVVDAALPDLGLATGGLVAGSANVDVRARGLVDALAIDADLRARGVRGQGVAIAQLTASASIGRLDLGAPLEGLAGKARLEAQGIEQGELRVERLAASASARDDGRRIELEASVRGTPYASRAELLAQVRRGAGRTFVAVPSAFAEIGGVRWQLQADEVAFAEQGPPRVSMRGVVLRSVAGEVRANGALDGPIPRLPEQRLQIVAKLDVAKAQPTIVALAGEAVPRELAGTVDLDVQVGRARRELEVSLDGRVRGVGWTRGADPLELDFTMSLQRRRLELDAKVRDTKSDAVVGLRVASAAPRDNLDAAAWQQLTRDDIEAIELSVESLTSATLARLSGVELPIAGALSATLSWPLDSGHGVRLKASTSGLAYRSYKGLGASLDLRWDREGLSGRLDATHRGQPVFTSALGLELGLEQAIRGGAPTVMGAPVRAELAFDRFSLARLTAAGLVKASLSGQLWAKVKVAGTLQEPLLRIDNGTLVSASLAGVRFKVIEFAGTANRDDVHVELRVDQVNGGQATLNVDYAVPKVELGLQLRAESIDLKALRAFATDPVSPLAEIGGILDADLALSGAVDRPSATGWLTLTNGSLLVEGGTRKLSDAKLRLEAAGSVISIETLSVQSSGGGAITGSGEVELDGLRPSRIEVDLALDGVESLAGSQGLTTDAKLELRAAVRDGALRGTLRFRESRVAVTQHDDELRSMGDLEDVVFVEQLEETTSSARSMPRVVMAIQTAEPIHVTSKELSGYVTIDLQLAVDGGEVASLTGDVQLTNRSSVILFDNRYQFERGLIIFGGINPLDPRLNLIISRPFPSGIVSIEITGHASDPQIRLRSDNAAYGEVQVLSIMLGQNPDDPSASQSAEEAAAGGVANLVAAQINERLLGGFADILKTHPDGIEVGKWLTNNILIGYRYRTAAADKNAGSEVTLEWRLKPNLFLESRYAFQGLGGADLLWILRW